MRFLAAELDCIDNLTAARRVQALRAFREPSFDSDPMDDESTPDDLFDGENNTNVQQRHSYTS